MYFQGDPLYPFGYGLSYTAFAYENLHLSSDRLAHGKSVTLSVEVSNKGHRAGEEVVQFYVQVSGVGRPMKQLAGFQRLSLNPGEKRTVAFSLSSDHIALQYWDEAKQSYAYEPGGIKLLVGSSSADIRLNGQITLE